MYTSNTRGRDQWKTGMRNWRYLCIFMCMHMKARHPRECLLRNSCFWVWLRGGSSLQWYIAQLVTHIFLLNQLRSGKHSHCQSLRRFCRNSVVSIDEEGALSLELQISEWDSRAVRPTGGIWEEAQAMKQKDTGQTCSILSVLLVYVSQKRRQLLLSASSAPKTFPRAPGSGLWQNCRQICSHNMWQLAPWFIIRACLAVCVLKYRPNNHNLVIVNSTCVTRLSESYSEEWPPFHLDREADEELIPLGSRQGLVRLMYRADKNDLIHVASAGGVPWIRARAHPDE